MAATNRDLWLIIIVLVISLTTSSAGGSKSWNNGSQNIEGQFVGRYVQTSLSFENLPDSLKTLFLTVDELINRTDVFLASNYSGNSQLLYNRQNHELTEKDLEPLASQIERKLVPGTWKAMTHTLGCCPSLEYATADEFLTNVYGRRKQIVQLNYSNPQRFQYTYRATCCKESYGTNEHCIEGYVLTSLAVFDVRLKPPITFDQFNIPSYCKCIRN